MARAARAVATFVVALLVLLLVSPLAEAAQLATSLTIKPTVTGRVVALTGRLVDVRDRAIQNAQLTVSLDATKLGTVTTGSSGEWNTSVTIPDSSQDGRHNIIVVFKGNNSYKGTASSVAVSIDSPNTSGPSDQGTDRPGLKQTTLTASAPSEPQLWGTLINVTGKLTGPGGSLVSGAPISVTGPDGIRSDCLTDGNGAYACELAVPAVEGSVELQARFDSMSGFAASSARTTLQVAAPATPSSEASSEEETPSPSPSQDVLASGSAQSSVPATPSTTPIAVAPTQSNYAPLLIALVGAFAVLGLGVLGLSLMRGSRREPVERFIDVDDPDDQPFFDDPLGATQPMPPTEPVARPGRYAAVTTSGHRFAEPAETPGSSAPRRALD